jgi:hypothetical protein
MNTKTQLLTREEAEWQTCPRTGCEAFPGEPCKPISKGDGEMHGSKKTGIHAARLKPIKELADAA